MQQIIIVGGKYTTYLNLYTAQNFCLFLEQIYLNL